MVISLIHPSRGRPQKSFANSMDWIERVGCEVELIVSIDDSDSYKIYEEYYSRSFCGGVIKRGGFNFYGIVNNNSSVVEATNRAAQKATGDILLYLSDDFKCFDNWGAAVLKEFEGESRPLLLKVDDCLQKFQVPVLTIPIMNRALYERLGYFWHPDYKSMWVDCDLFETCNKIGAIKNAPHLKFPHEHPSIGKAQNDETYTRSAANWDQGLNVFNRRKAQGFPI